MCDMHSNFSVLARGSEDGVNGAETCGNTVRLHLTKQMCIYGVMNEQFSSVTKSLLF